MPHHQQPPPGTLSTLLTRLLRPAGLWAAPAQAWGSCYSVPNPVGRRAIYLDAGPALLSARSPLQEKLHFTHPTPTPRSLAASGVGVRTWDSHPSAPRPFPSCTGGLAPAHFPDRGGCVFVEVPAGPLGSWTFSSPAALFYLCFCLQMGVGSSGGRAALPPRVTRGALARAIHRAGLDLPLPHQGPHCEVTLP